MLHDHVAAAMADADDEDLITKNLPLALSFTTRFIRKFPVLDADDIAGTVLVALCQAARGFDPERNRKFSTYFSTVANNEIAGLLIQHLHQGARLPAKTSNQVRAMQQYRDKYGDLPTLDEINQENLFDRKTPVPEERYRELLQALSLVDELPADFDERYVAECRRRSTEED